LRDVRLYLFWLAQQVDSVGKPVGAQLDAVFVRRPVVYRLIGVSRVGHAHKLRRAHAALVSADSRRGRRVPFHRYAFNRNCVGSVVDARKRFRLAVAAVEISLAEVYGACRITGKPRSLAGSGNRNNQRLVLVFGVVGNENQIGVIGAFVGRIIINRHNKLVAGIERMIL